ncbi:MAG: hypothetical protein ACREID_05655, partial [Planctomycetota bacterium]
MHEALRPWTPDSASPWDFDAAAHLWRRAAFGATPERVEAALQKSPQEAASALVAGPAQDPAARELDAVFGSVAGLGILEP